jgi:hypothetical protein
VFVDVFLVNAYGRRKLEGPRVVVSHRMAANGLAIGRSRAIARVSNARRAVASANAVWCGAGLLVAGDGYACQAGELGRYFGCRLAQATA